MNKRFFNQQNLTRRLRLLSVLFAMVIIPNMAWGQWNTKTFIFNGATDDILYAVDSNDETMSYAWYYRVSGHYCAGLVESKVKISVGDNYGKGVLTPPDNFTIKKVTLNYSNLQVTEGSKIYVRAVNRTDTTTHYTDPYLMTSDGTLDIDLTDEGILSDNLCFLIFSDNDKAYSYILNSITITKIADYHLSIGGVFLTGSNVNPETGAVTGLTGVYFTPANNTASPATPATLTLNGAAITGQITSSIDALTVHLVGKNTITPGSGNSPFVYNGSLDNGTLTFESSNSEGGELKMNDISAMESIGSGYTVSNDFDYYDRNGVRWIKEVLDYVNIYYNVYYGITVSGTAVSKCNKDMIKDLSGDVSYTPEDNTLHIPDNPSVSDYEIQSHLSALNVSIHGDCALKSISFVDLENDEFPATSGTLTIMQDEANAGNLNRLTLSDENGVIRGFTSVTIVEPLKLRSSASTEALATASSAVISNYATAYNITVAGVQVTDENATGITGTGITTGTVSFTPAGDTTPATLTLNGANLTEGITTSINGLVIDLIGDNTITSSTQAPIKGTGDTEPTLTLKSSGTTVGSLKLIPTEASNYNITQDATLTLVNPLVRCDDGNNVYFEEGYQLTVGGAQMSKHTDLAGMVGGISANNAYNHETNTLTLDGWHNDNASIVSGLPVLNIKLMGSSSFSNIMANTDIEGTKTLVFQTEDSESVLALAEAISGFNNVTYQNNLVFRTIIGEPNTYSVETISKPTMTGDGNNVTFNFNAGLELHYSIDYAKEGVTDVTDVTIATSGTSVALSGPCTVTAYTKWNNSQSDNVVGKLFGFASNTVETTYSEEVTLPTIIPTLPEGITLFYNVHEGENTARVTSDDETGTITGYLNVGEATVNVELRYEESPDFIILNEMDGDFETLGDFTLTVVPKSLTNDMIQAIADQTYAGTALTPAIVVKDGETTLTQAENAEAEGDFTVAFSNNTNAALSTAETAPTVTITGKGNYTGTATKTFTIAAKDLASATVTVDATQTYTYTGAAIEPNISSVSIKLTEGADVATNLTAGTDYTVTGYANNTDAALATAETNAPTVTITGKGNFTGTATGTFTIAQAKLSVVTIAPIADQTFTGSQITPEVTVTFNDAAVSTTEYNVVYGENTNAGENAGTVTLTSKNKNFVTSTDEDATTKKTATFNIVAATAAITATDQTVTFNGGAQEFTNYTIANGEAAVTYYSSEEARAAQSDGTTSAPTNADTYYVQVTQGDANYISEPANATFIISPKSLTAEMVTLSATSFVYSGSDQTPTVTVKDGAANLTGDDYTYAIKQGETVVASPTNVGSYSVVVTGKGNYSGTATQTFTIAAKDLASATVTVDPNQTYTYTGSAIEPNVSSVSIMLTEGADVATNLTAGTDYTVTDYANNTDAALATAVTNAPTVTITGKGNFTGTATGTFTIAQAKLSAVTIAAIGNQTYTGSQITPEVTVTFNGNDVSTNDYNVVYGDNINAGENAGTVTLTSKNKNFVASTDEDAATKKTATFNIVAATAAITATDQTVTFNGGAQAFTNYTIANGEEVVTYYSSEEARAAKSGGTTSAPTNADTYYVQVTQGDANYTSDPANATFTISPMTLTSEMVTLTPTSFNYTGGVQVPYITVKLNEETELTSSVDYTFGYQRIVEGEASDIAEPQDAGNYYVVITGKGNYTGTVKKQFSIGLTPATVTAPVATNPTYTGSAQNLVTAGETDGGTVVYSLTENGEYSETIPQATDADSYTVYYKATGDDNHSPSEVGNVAATIAKANLGDVTIAEIGDQTYTGSQITPTVTVTFGGKAVAEDEYTISYGTNTNVGEGSVTLTSEDINFSTTSTKGATFTIVAKALTDAMVADIAAQTYNGTELEPALTVTDGETPLVKDTHYEVTYSNNKNAGTTAKATITGKGNYSGSIDKFFTINKAQLTVTADDKTYNVGDEITLTVSYEGFVNGETETALTTQPTASYGTVDITKPGSYTITVNGGEATNYSFNRVPGTLTINRMLDINFSGSNEWATYYASENLATPEGLQAYQVTAVNGTTVTTSEIGYIPANTAVLLQNTDVNTPTKSNIPASAYTGATSTFEDNILKASASAVDVSSITTGTVYILINNMFRRATGTIPARRGYLVVNSSNAPQLSITIGDDTTGIGTAGCDSVATDNDEWYSIDGVKLNGQPQKPGLYIKNGKKVVINKK